MKAPQGLHFRMLAQTIWSPRCLREIIYTKQSSAHSTLHTSVSYFTYPTVPRHSGSLDFRYIGVLNMACIQQRRLGGRRMSLDNGETPDRPEFPLHRSVRTKAYPPDRMREAHIPVHRIASVVVNQLAEAVKLFGPNLHAPMVKLLYPAMANLSPAPATLHKTNIDCAVTKRHIQTRYITHAWHAHVHD